LLVRAPDNLRRAEKSTSSTLPFQILVSRAAQASFLAHSKPCIGAALDELEAIARTFQEPARKPVFILSASERTKSGPLCGISFTRHDKTREFNPSLSLTHAPNGREALDGVKGFGYPTGRNVVRPQTIVRSMVEDLVHSQLAG